MYNFFFFLLLLFYFYILNTNENFNELGNIEDMLSMPIGNIVGHLNSQDTKKFVL